jgi:hypothetical protein
MTLDAFKASLTASTPPEVGPLLQALWYDARGDWDRAHRVAQDIDEETGAWIHAYLHRKEGDSANAAYWYRRAGRPVASGSLEDEWTGIVRVLLESDPLGRV